MMHISQYFPITDPTWIFFLVLCIILFAPIIMGRLRIPHLIGMVLAGVLIGPHGLNILTRDSSFELFGKVGLYYIMFLAGLEMDMKGLMNNKGRCLSFGLATFLIPFVTAYIMGIGLLHYSMLATLLLACILSSNTLVTYPIVGRYGLQRHTSVTLSVGSTMISLFLSLIILAAIAGSFNASTGVAFWILFIIKFTAFCAGEIFFLPRLTRWFFRRYSDAVMQFIYVMSVLFFSAALSELCGLEGIFGAFFAGLVLNRFIPHVSPLMNRIEFTGNALFIPYFLIGVGMLINIRALFYGWGTLYVVLCMVILGTLSKCVAAYLSNMAFRMPISSGHMMFGLTSAHAAGAIAMVMVGTNLEVSPGVYLMNNDVLNGVVIMILFTCIISSIVTENAAKKLVLEEGSRPEQDNGDDEKILIPMTKPDSADELVNIAIMMRNPRLNRGLIGLSVVYDDNNSSHNQELGRKLLEHAEKTASAADVRMQTQSRIATNVTNGIMHAFKEYDASELIIGLHENGGSPKNFWGTLTKSLCEELSRQIMIVKCLEPINTLRRIQVAVPSKAEYEPGFYRWVERLARLAGNLGCRIQFHGRPTTMSLINEYIQNRHNSVRADYSAFNNWDDLPTLSAGVNPDHLFVVITARNGTVSYLPSFENLPEQLLRYFSDNSLMIVFPDQYGDSPDVMTFASPKRQQETNAYVSLRRWLKRHIKV
jgi:Kef-type K+ transport system membrane component KefB